MTEHFFSLKIHFCQNLGKEDLKWLEIRFSWIFKKILSLAFPENDAKWKLILSLIFHHYSHIYQNSASQVMGPKYCWSIKLQDSLKCNISRKKQIMKFIFGMQINMEVFYMLILSFWVWLVRHTKSTQNKFALLL